MSRRFAQSMNLCQMKAYGFVLLTWGLIATVAAVDAFPPPLILERLARLFFRGNSTTDSPPEFPSEMKSSNENDCSLNGDLHNGQCVCDAAWDGPECEFLRLLPANPYAGLQLHRQHPNNNGLYSSWGGSVIEGSCTYTRPYYPFAHTFTH